MRALPDFFLARFSFLLMFFHIFLPLFFRVTVLFSVPSHPTVRLRGDRRYAYIPLAGLRGVYILMPCTPDNSHSKAAIYRHY